MNVFQANNGILFIGIREGEKMHETLVTQEELVKSEDLDDYYRIRCDKKMDYDEYFVKGTSDQFPPEGYTSANTKRLTIPEIEELLLTVPEIQQELA